MVCLTFIYRVITKRTSCLGLMIRNLHVPLLVSHSKLHLPFIEKSLAIIMAYPVDNQLVHVARIIYDLCGPNWWLSVLGIPKGLLGGLPGIASTNYVFIFFN